MLGMVGTHKPTAISNTGLLYLVVK